MSMEIRPIDANALCEVLKDWRGDKLGLKEVLEYICVPYE